jgi:hypothetical protein
MTMMPLWLLLLLDAHDWVDEMLQRGDITHWEKR